MKNTFFISSLSNRLSKMMLLIAIFTSAICLASPAEPGNANHEKRATKKHPKSLGQQIGQFIQLENTELAAPKNGIVVISFSVDENNQLTQVISYSRIPAIDRYLTSRLEGKVVELPAGRKSVNGQQFIKLRFSLQQ